MNGTTQPLCVRFRKNGNREIPNVTHEDIFTLHRILAETVMDQGTAGRYR
ncbi:MAG: hypothetical protein JWM99_2740, partial [Verrucomicrobiales bacterium]|nr:hypothetical protein [Verrucomicrobiales bacterium]